jgi:hypothetical protein
VTGVLACAVCWVQGAVEAKTIAESALAALSGEAEGMRAEVAGAKKQLLEQVICLSCPAFRLDCFHPRSLVARPIPVFAGPRRIIHAESQPISPMRKPCPNQI